MTSTMVAAIADRLSRHKDGPFRLIQSTTAQDPERDCYQVLDKNDKEVFAGKLEDVVSKYLR